MIMVYSDIIKYILVYSGIFGYILLDYGTFWYILVYFAIDLCVFLCTLLHSAFSTRNSVVTGTRYTLCYQHFQTFCSKEEPGYSYTNYPVQL